MSLTDRERCFVCERIDTKRFYRELREWGFNSEQAEKTVGLIAKCYRKKPYLFCGKKTKTIKATFAYIGGVLFGVLRPSSYYGEPTLHVPTQLDCAGKWNIREIPIRNLYPRILDALSIDFPKSMIKKHYTPRINECQQESM
jgi:hypothetical protein